MADTTPIADGASDTWQRPSPRLRTVRRAQVASITLPLAFIGLGAGVAAGAASAGVATLVAVTVVAVVLDMLLARRVRAWGFAERGRDLLVRRGVMFRRLSVIPHGRMQYVDVTAGPFERAFGLATVRMHTAAAASDARIPGLPAAEATRLRDHLSALGESQATGL